MRTRASLSVDAFSKASQLGHLNGGNQNETKPKQNLGSKSGPGSYYSPIIIIAAKQK